MTARAPLQVSGSITGSGTGSAIHVYDPATDPNIRLEAGSIQLRYHWENGVETHSPAGGTILQREAEEGSTTRVFTDAELTIQSGDDPLQYLAFPNRSSPDATVGGIGTTTISTDLPQVLTRFGDSGQTQSAGDEIVGFWYEPSSAWLKGDSADSATLSGDFSVFINNATATIRDPSGIAWQNWTGHRTSEEAGIAAAYEERLLVLDIQDGQLRVEAPGAVSFFGPSFAIETTGGVTSERVDGEMAMPSGRVLFDGERMELEGQGTVTVTKTQPEDASPMELTLDQASDFRVRGGTPVEAQGEGGLLPSSPSLLTGGVALLLVGAVVATTYATGAAGRWYEAVQARRYERAMSTGFSLARDLEYERASQEFRRAAEIDSDDIMAWFQLALAHLETGEYQQALDVLEEARDHGTVDELDFLEVEVEAAHQLGDIDRCRRALGELAEASLPMARSLVEDLDLDARVLGDNLEARLRKSEGPGGLPGYV